MTRAVAFRSIFVISKLETYVEGTDGEVEIPSLIRRIVLGYHKVAHYIRWGLLLACIAGFIVSAIYAAGPTLPTSSDVRLLDADSSQFEVNYEWRVDLLSEILGGGGGGGGGWLRFLHELACVLEGVWGLWLMPHRSRSLQLLVDNWFFTIALTLHQKLIRYVSVHVYFSRFQAVGSHYICFLSQEYLVGFCDELIANEFATKTDEDYVCPINAFDL